VEFICEHLRGYLVGNFGEIKEKKTYLDYDLHKVLLGNNILTLDDLLQDGGEDAISIEL
jgi:hypothetical protein